MPKAEPLGLRLELSTYYTGPFFWGGGVYLASSLRAAFHSSVRAILYMMWLSLLILVNEEGGGGLCEGCPSPALSPPFARDHPFFTGVAREF